MIDPLTALPNRRGFELGTKVAHAAASRYGQSYAILSADLDGLKRVNDVLGHAAGDRVINAFTASLRATTRGSDILGRLGGDEFAALLLGADAEGASVVERKRSALFADELSRIGISAGVSIGVAVFPGDGATPEELLALGDSRMYGRKAARISVRTG